MNTKSENKKQVRGLSKMVLLNSEGDILTAYKKDGEFLIMDEYYEIITSLTSDELFKFTRGEKNLINSQSEEFNYPSYCGDMKPDLKSLDEFIGVDTSKFTY